jgi:hypothetical protein
MQAHRFLSASEVVFSAMYHEHWDARSLRQVEKFRPSCEWIKLPGNKTNG